MPGAMLMTCPRIARRGHLEHLIHGESPPVVVFFVSTNGDSEMTVTFFDFATSIFMSTVASKPVLKDDTLAG